METIYWIQRLAAINVVAWIIFAISCVALIVFSAMYPTNLDFVDSLPESEREVEVAKRGFKFTSWIIGMSLLVGIFVPTESQLYMIYGVGGTIDYIKNNDTAKQLPDKVINALDAWVDKQIGDDSKDK